MQNYDKDIGLSLNESDPFCFTPLTRIKNKKCINESLSSQNIFKDKKNITYSSQYNTIKQRTKLKISSSLISAVVNNNQNIKKDDEVKENYSLLNKKNDSEIYRSPDLDFNDLAENGKVNLKTSINERASSLDSDSLIDLEIEEESLKSFSPNQGSLSKRKEKDDSEQNEMHVNPEERTTNLSSNADEDISILNITKNYEQNSFQDENITKFTKSRSQRNFNESNVSTEIFCNVNNNIDFCFEIDKTKNLTPLSEPIVNTVEEWLTSTHEYLTPPRENSMSPNPVSNLNKRKSFEIEKDSNSTHSVASTSSKAAKMEPCIHLHIHVDSSNEKDLYCNSSEVSTAWKNILGTKKISQLCKNTLSAKQSTTHDGYWSNSKKKYCPKYKHVEDTSFVVDAFSYGEVTNVSCYFLSHFHYDHYTGLTKHFKKPLYCSQITANLIALKIKLDAKYINVLPLGEARVIKEIEVTLFEANHCPGAVMFLFNFPTGKSILHVGDFRAHESMENISELVQSSPFDVLYLDTTYLDPSYNFPSQKEVLGKCRLIARTHTNSTSKEVRFAVGSYTIGKEKVFCEIAEELDCLIYADGPKANILQCLQDEHISSRLTRDKNKARVHVVAMKQLSKQKLQKYVEPFGTNIEWVAIKPTGWTFNEQIANGLHNLRPEKIANISFYGLPYSEHSSYAELERFVKFFKPHKIIPTSKLGPQVMQVVNRWIM